MRHGERLLDRVELVLGAGHGVAGLVAPPRDIADRVDIGRRLAGGVAEHAVAGVEPAARQPPGGWHPSDRHDDDVGGNHRPVGEGDGLHVTVAEHVRDFDARSDVDPVVPVQLLDQRRQVVADLPEAHPPGAADEHDIAVQLASGRRDLGPQHAAADDDDPPGRRHVRAQRGGVVDRAQGVDAGETADARQVAGR